jgi:uncharacterized protein (UPF0297 family)
MDSFKDLKSCVDFYKRTGPVLHLKVREKQIKCVFHSYFIGSDRGRIIGIIISHDTRYIFQYTSKRLFGQIMILENHDLINRIFEKYFPRKNLDGIVKRSPNFIRDILRNFHGETNNV